MDFVADGHMGNRRALTLTALGSCPAPLALKARLLLYVVQKHAFRVHEERMVRMSTDQNVCLVRNPRLQTEKGSNCANSVELVTMPSSSAGCSETVNNAPKVLREK